MRKLKIMTVLGTRPEIIRLSRVISKLDEYCDHTLVHTGQNYDFELNEIFFQDLGVRHPDHYLGAAGATGSETIGRVILEVDRLLAESSPDALLVLGDTNSCMAVLPAKRRKIPTFHMEAGNRCFDQRVPEEINRRIVDHTADINLTYSDIAREYLLCEGLPPDLIIKTGSPMFEVLEHYGESIASSTILDSLGLDSKKYFLVSTHREENIEPDDSFHRLVEVLNAVANTYEIPIVVSTHPRTKKRIDQAGVTLSERVRLLKPLSFTDYNKLQLHAKAVLSDSGTINEEASILNFPALNLREAHERPEGMEEGAVMLVGFNLERILQGLAILADQPRGEERLIRLPSDYSMPNVSDKIVRIVHSYTDYVNRTVWKNY
ncbi:non-hydrolyzing UDP-N-acetylglucosamine 2-epimerase [Altererythrobacter sp. Root672]|uniref:non-hydrolyzing UDP-N-acetylglucosamine 2-epimerase n=1 Tax=Altererythrobacter sp. Root672 TaxID=1736584 RepID=UPI0006F47B34|nr:UDP-N-acetylglucosamine 2-epimerase (non-hydrolyzing) [Altererythrobacter sp. Root672]KRA83188.1 UDP-N-acetyl glucosamine 2-epimerase [Altererythrobacter sp. Root672]